MQLPPSRAAKGLAVMRARRISCWKPRAHTLASSRLGWGRRGRSRNGRSSGTFGQFPKRGSGVALHVAGHVLQVVLITALALDLSGRQGFRQRVGNAGEEQPHKGVEGRVQGLIGAMQLPDIPGKPVERRPFAA